VAEESVGVAPAVVEVLVVVFPPQVVSVAFCYSVLAGRALVASHAGLLPKVFGHLALPGRYPGPCYRTAIRCGHHLVVALAPVSVALPVLPPSSEAVAAIWEEWEQVVGSPGAEVQVVFWPALAGLAAEGETHLAVVATGVWQQAAQEEAGRKRKLHNNSTWSTTDRRIYKRRREFFMIVGAATAS
jgi:hypothetical protein